ncbi:MAG TPA: ROK family protein [Arachnia sp.]|nr:ROK family protein [Arachnia sp.]HMT85654.1 ROK family protein [Arachnia sp.]
MTVSRLDPTSRRVVEMVLRHGPISRVEMVQRTGLSSGSLTRITSPLVGSGVLVEGQGKPAPVGRPSRPLEVVDGAARFLGIKVVPGRIYATLVGLRGRVHGTAIEEADTSSAETTARAIATLLDARAPRWAPEAIGVSLAAAVDPFGTVRAARLLGWEGGNITGAVAAVTGLRCAAANDVEALALAEHWFGRGRGAHNFVVLTVGAGVGAGAIVDDTLLSGHQGAAAMLGRAWASDGRTFHEVLATEPLLRRACAATGRPVGVSDLAGGEAAVAEVLDDAAGVLGELAALAKLAFGPDRILIAGEGVVAFVGRTEAVVRGMTRHCYEDLETPELVMGDEIDFLDWARGGAALAIRDTLR